MNNNTLFTPQIFEQLPGCWGCKDQHSTYIYTNAEFAKMLGFDDCSEAIGKNDHQIPGRTPECAQTYIEQDLLVMKTGKTIQVLDIHPYSDGKWRAHIFTKSPWRNSDNQIIGTILSGIELKNTAVLEIGHWLCKSIGFSQAKYSAIQHNLSISNHRIELNNRESEVLFLLLYGKKPQYIANTLGLAVKTIENYVIKLREKFNANTKGELLDLALEHGFGSNIPESMLKTRLSIVLKD